MNLHVLPLALVLMVLPSFALILPFKQNRRSSSLTRRSGRTKLTSYQPPKALAHTHVMAAAGSNSGNNLDLNTVRDLIYMANVTIGDRDYPIQLDTGSSDLWVKGPVTPLPNTNQTSTTFNLTYGIGWAYGHVSYATVNFAGIEVKNQALLDVSSAQNPALSYGAVGILGLGFTSLSTVDALVNATGASAGRSLLYNLFEDNRSEPNFIAFALQRSAEPDDEVEGSFSIGEYEHAYAKVADKPAIPTWPVSSPKRWNVLLEAVLVGNKTILPTTTVPGAPSNRAVVLLDSGTSYTYVPKEICDAIYGDISGAQFDANLGQWIVPCSTEIDMALQIGGEVYPLHPLDVTPPGLTDPSTCVGSFVPQSVSVGSGQFDWLTGDNFLRSVYSVYDFGDFDSNGQMGNPYVKLLSLVDPNQASMEFHKVRGGTPQTNITYNTINAGEADSSSASITLSADLAKTLDKVGKYFPIMLGAIALNTLVLLIICIVAIVFVCTRRRRRRSPPARTPIGRLTPMPMSHRNSQVDLPPAIHTYEPVSMALSEDTMMVPLSPGFKVFENGVLRPGDRPQSIAPSASYQQLASPTSEDTLFVPPQPAFHDRPRSVA